MLEHLQILVVLLPVFFLIMLGFALSQSGFPGKAFWEPAEKLTYYLLLPALLIQKIAAPNPNSSSLEALTLMAAMLGSLLVLTLLLLVLRPLFFTHGPSFTSVYQGTIRFNSYIGISIVLFLFGEQGVLTAAILLAFLIPLVNVISITILIRFGRDQIGDSTKRRAIFRAVLTNPVVIACLLGLLLRHGEVPIPAPVDNLLDIMGRAALPLGLLAVGAALEPAVLRLNSLLILTVTTFKLLLYPLLAWSFCLLLAVPPLPTKVAVIFAALPGSALSTILARQLGGDTPLISGITTAQTLAAALTLPILLYLIL